MKRKTTLCVGVIAIATAALWLGSPTHAQDAAPIKQPVLMFKPIAAGADLPGEDPEISKNAYFRAKVPGGWILSNPPNGILFLPDAKHAWDGGSLD